MSKVIEILDSDDDNEASPPMLSSMVSRETASTAPVVATMVEPQAEIEAEIVEKAHPTDSFGSSPLLTATQALSKGRIRNRRKSIHQPMRSSPEMQFETIALLDDDDDVPAGKVNKRPHSSGTAVNAVQVQKPPKTFKTTPKILTSKPPTPEEQVSAACEEFTNTGETQALLRRIAEERVRVNFLLASFGMPDIHFSLYTQSDRLQFQLEDRLKQRKMRNRGLLESKKRRSLLQNTQSQGPST